MADEQTSEGEAGDVDAVVNCICRACGATFENPYDIVESFICDACLAKPLPKPKGVFEDVKQEANSELQPRGESAGLGATEVRED